MNPFPAGHLCTSNMAPNFTWAGHRGEVRNSAGTRRFVQARWSAWAARSRLGVQVGCQKKWEVVHTLLVFVSISFPELSYGSISFHQFSIIVPCSYKYTYMLLCKDMVSCHHRNLEQIEQNRNNNWTHSNVRVHCRPRCCIVGPNLGWLWRKSVPPIMVMDKVDVHPWSV